MSLKLHPGCAPSTSALNRIIIELVITSTAVDDS
jgi:hypothetical protein